MFTNIAEIDGAPTTDELFLFHASSPLGDQWHPHPLNPIVSDARYARSAGALITIDGRIYRPSQKCTPHYGHGLNLFEVAVLSTTDYEEHLVSQVLPTWSE